MCLRQKVTTLVDELWSLSIREHASGCCVVDESYAVHSGFKSIAGVLICGAVSTRRVDVEDVQVCDTAETRRDAGTLASSIDGRGWSI